MFRAVLCGLKGCLSLLLYALNLLCCAAIIIAISLIICIVPIRSWRYFIHKRILQRMPTVFDYTNHCIMMISTRDKWEISGAGALQKEGWYVMISNHRSWIDILILGSVFNRLIPPLKFFMKKELLWQLPLAGLACYMLGYPFMSRHSHAEIRKNPALKGKDIETTKKACARLRQFPTTLINFIEGTRYTKKKSERQQSPFKHLLKPHAGGVAVALYELKDILDGIVSVIICYPKKTPSLWEFACGKFEKIIVRYELLTITPDLVGDYFNDRNFRPHMQQWLNALWQKNDLLIEELVHEKSPH